MSNRVEHEPPMMASAITGESARISAEFNAAINFALDKAGCEGLTFLSLWREGAWAEINAEWPEFKRPNHQDRIPQAPVLVNRDTLNKAFIFNVDNHGCLSVNASKKEPLELFLNRVCEQVGVAKEVTIWTYRYANSSVLAFDVKNDDGWFALNIQPVGETNLVPNGFLGDVYVQDWVDAHHLGRLLLQRLGFADAKVDSAKSFFFFPNGHEMEMTQIQLQIKGCPHCHAKPMIREDKPSEFSDRFECECNEHALVQIDRGVQFCPDCGAPKKVHQVQSFTIKCQQHPEHPVCSSQDSLELVLWRWNDDDYTWLFFGAVAEKLSSRPMFQVELHSLAVGV